MNPRIWIRIDKANGDKSEVPEAIVKEKVRLSYRNFREAMGAASEKSPLENAFAIYYPKE